MGLFLTAPTPRSLSSAGSSPGRGRQFPTTGGAGYHSLLPELAIDGLNLEKEVSSPTPANAVFGSVAVLLTTIWVRFLRFCDGTFQTHTQVGHDGQ